MLQWEYHKGRWRDELKAQTAEDKRRREVEQMLSPAPGSMGFLEAAAEYIAI